MLKLIKPGERKGNRYYIIRGRFQGVDIEKTTETTHKSVAERIKSEIEERIRKSQIPGRGDHVTFHAACDIYQATHQLHPNDIAAINRLKRAIEDRPLSRIGQADVDKAAETLHPDKSPEWRNRSVYTPAIAVMNYAALNEWTHFRKWQRPKLKAPEPRPASDDAFQALLSATTGKEHLMILWLFLHGTRVTNALAVAWERINLDRATYDLFVQKTRHWQTFPIHPRVLQILKETPEKERTGPLFPWGSRWQVYDWLVPLRDRLNIKFTPHMARHWLGKQLDAQGAGIKTIATALGHRSTRATARYISPDLETVRAAMERAGETLGKAKKT
jgi:integrase